MEDYYIFKNGNLRRKDNTIHLEDSSGEKQSIPINNVYSLHLFGEINFNTKFIVFLNQYGIPIHFYNYYGHYSGSFYPREKLLSGFLLVKQVENYLDIQKRIILARELVKTATDNILFNLKHYEKNGKKVTVFINKIKDQSTLLDIASDIQSLMGIEGRVRQIYYSAFEFFLRSEFEFKKRTRLPPQNMLNSLISFGNSLLYSSILTEIYHTQLSPTISYLHEPGERRYSLSLDISEVFKPIIVDRIIFNLINNRLINEKYFIEDIDFCYLNENGKKLFLNEYNHKLETTVMNSKLGRKVSYKRMMRLECFKILKHLLGENVYKGLRMKY